MKGKILGSTLIVLLVLVAITYLTFVAKPLNPSVNPLNIFLVEIESVQAKTNSDAIFEEENNALLNNNIAHITNKPESNPTLASSVKDVASWAKVSGIPDDIADSDNDTNPVLDETQVDTYVADNGYLTSESAPIANANVKEEVNCREFSGITASFSVRPAP